MTRLQDRSRLQRLAGLTFGEMLVVLAVFLVLAIMFVFSSQYAVVKSKYSRVLSDERSLGKAIDQYVADHMRLPPSLDALMHSRFGSSYISELPTDPFAADQSGFEYYVNIGDHIQVIIVSVGPDGVSDIRPELIERMRENVELVGVREGPIFRSQAEAEEFILRNTYDPTNGAVSRGDIIQVHTYFGF